jgi:signal transduction histidine kinase
VLGSAVVLLATVLAAFAVGLLHNRATQRQAAEQRFRDEARVTAALTETIFGSNLQQASERSTATLGDRTVSLRELNKRAETDHVAYAVVLDDKGEPLASTAGAGPPVMRRIASKPEHITQVASGAAPVRLSSFVDDATMEYAAAFTTPGGERRVIVEGFSAPLVAGFLGGYIANLPDAKRQIAYIVDADDRVVATTGPARLGEPADATAGGRRIAEAPIGGAEWRVVLAKKPAELYGDVGSTLQWIVLITLGIAGGGIVALLAGLSRRDAALRTANAGLERANDELVRSNGELDQFASIASHDLQEPLRKVQGFGDQLEKRFSDDLPEEAQDYVRRMRKAAGRMSTLIDDLLRLSRVTTHAAPPERVELTGLAREVVGDLDAEGCVIVDRLPAVEADPVQMRQLLQNLIANALKFHRPEVPPLVRLGTRPGRTPDHVAFAVTDNGIGFEPEHEERIFRVFERLHTRDVFPGTGIGLALCRRIVERTGGRISAQGRPGEGSVFTVELPAALGYDVLFDEPEREATHA